MEVDAGALHRAAHLPDLPHPPAWLPATVEAAPDRTTPRTYAVRVNAPGHRLHGWTVRVAPDSLRRADQTPT